MTSFRAHLNPGLLNLERAHYYGAICYMDAALHGRGSNRIQWDHGSCLWSSLGFTFVPKEVAQ